MCSSDLGRPSQDSAGAPSSAAPSSSAPAAAILSNPSAAERVLKTPAAPTPSRATTGGSQLQEEEQAQHAKGPRATGFHMKKVTTKTPVKPTRASTSLAKDKSPAKKDSSIVAEKSTPEKDHPLDDF